MLRATSPGWPGDPDSTGQGGSKEQTDTSLPVMLVLLACGHTVSGRALPQVPLGSLQRARTLSPAKMQERASPRGQVYLGRDATAPTQLTEGCVTAQQ